MRFEGRVVLVTGASRGIGREIAVGFGREGPEVVVNYTSSETKANEVVKEIEKHGVIAIAIRCDISDERQARDMTATAVQKFGRLDILVKNAGIGFGSQFTEIKTEEWKRASVVNIL